MTAVAGSSLLIDSNILIDYLRGRHVAINYLRSLPVNFNVSVVNVAELYAGVREGAERTQLDAFVRAFVTLPIDSDIAVVGGLYRRDFGRTHGTGLHDALIAATATVHNLTLVTLNQRHFPMLIGVIVPH